MIPRPLRRRRADPAEELSALVARLGSAAGPPVVVRTRRGIAVAVTREPDGTRHVSLSGDRIPTAVLCELAARAVDGIDTRSALLGPAALHVRTGGRGRVTGDQLLRAVARGAEPGSVPASRRAYFGR